MRKVYLITAILLLSAVWVAAQTTPSSGTQANPSSTTSPSSQSTTPDTSSTTTQTTTTQTTQTSSDNSSSSIEGCLNGSAGNFTLTDTSGKTWQLAGDTSKLSDHVGHQIRIMGTDASSSSSSSSGASGSSNPNSSTNPGSGSATGGAGAGANTSPSSGVGGSSASQGTFNVSKVKMISSSCSTTSK